MAYIYLASQSLNPKPETLHDGSQIFISSELAYSGWVFAWTQRQQGYLHGYRSLMCVSVDTGHLPARGGLAGGGGTNDVFYEAHQRSSAARERGPCSARRRCVSPPSALPPPSRVRAHEPASRHTFGHVQANLYI